MHSDNYGDRFGITATCYELYETFQIEIQDLKKHISSAEEITKSCNTNDEEHSIGEKYNQIQQQNIQTNSNLEEGIIIIISRNNSHPNQPQICKKILLNKIECISEIVEGMFAKLTSVMNGAEKSKDGSQLLELQEELQLSQQIIHQQTEQLDRLNSKRIKWQDKKQRFKQQIQELNEQISDQRIAIRNLQEETANLVKEESEKTKKMDKWFVRLLEKIELDLVEQQSNKLQAVVEKVRNARKNKPWKGQLVYSQAQSMQQGRRSEGIANTPLNMYSDINQEDFSPASSEGQDNMAASGDCSINKAIVFSDGQCSCVFNTDRRKHSEEEEQHKNNLNSHNINNNNSNNMCYDNNLNQNEYQLGQDNQHQNKLRIKYQQQQQVRLNLAELTQEKVSHFIRQNNLDMSVSQLEQEVLNYFQKTDRSTTNTQLNLKDVQLEDILNVTQQNNSASLELDFQKEANRTIDRLLSGLQNTLSKKQHKNDQNNNNNNQNNNNNNNNNNNEDFLSRNTGNNEDFPQELSPISSEKTLTLHLSGVALPGALRSQIAFSSSVKQRSIQPMPQYVLTKKYTHNPLTTNTDLFILKEIADSENKEDGVNDSNQVFQVGIKNVQEFKEDIIDSQQQQRGCQMDIKENKEISMNNQIITVKDKNNKIQQLDTSLNQQIFQDKSIIPSSNKLSAESNTTLSLQTMLENIKIEDQQENITSPSCQDVSCFDKLNEALVQYTEERSQCCSISNSRVFPSTERNEHAKIQQLLFSNGEEKKNTIIGNSDKPIEQSKIEQKIIQLESQDKNGDFNTEIISNDLNQRRLDDLDDQVWKQQQDENEYQVLKNDKNFNIFEDNNFDNEIKDDFDDIHDNDDLGGLHELSNKIQDFSQISIIPSENYSNSSKKYPVISQEVKSLHIQDFNNQEISTIHGIITPSQHQLSGNQCQLQKVVDKPPIIPINNMLKLSQQQQQLIQHQDNQFKKVTTQQMSSFQVSLDSITLASNNNNNNNNYNPSEHYNINTNQLQIVSQAPTIHESSSHHIENVVHNRNIFQQNNHKLSSEQINLCEKDKINASKPFKHGQSLILEDSQVNNLVCQGIQNNSTKANNGNNNNNNNNNNNVLSNKEGFQGIKQIRLVNAEKIKKDISNPAGLLVSRNASSNATPNVSIHAQLDTQNTHNNSLSKNKNNNNIVGHSPCVTSPFMQSSNQRSINGTMQQEQIPNSNNINPNQNITTSSISSNSNNNIIHAAVVDNSQKNALNSNHNVIDNSHSQMNQQKISSIQINSAMRSGATNSEENLGGDIPRHKKKKALLIVNKSYDFGNSMINQQQQQQQPQGSQVQLQLVNSPVNNVGQIYTGPISASSALSGKSRLIQEGMARQIRSVSKRIATVTTSGCPLRSSTPSNPKDRVSTQSQDCYVQWPSGQEAESIIKSTIMRAITQPNCQDGQIYQMQKNIRKEETFKTAPDCCLGFYTIPTLEIEEDEEDNDEESQITLKSIGLQKKNIINKRAISIDDDESKRFRKAKSNNIKCSPMMNAGNINNNTKIGMNSQTNNQGYSNIVVHSAFTRGIQIEDKENASRQVHSEIASILSPSGILKNNINVNNNNINNSKQQQQHVNLNISIDNQQKQQQQQSKLYKSPQQCLTPTSTAGIPQKILLKKQKKAIIPVNVNQQQQQSNLSNVAQILTSQPKCISTRSNTNNSTRINQLAISQNHSIDSLNNNQISKTPNSSVVLKEWERCGYNNNNSSSLPRYSSSLRNSGQQQQQ